MISEETARLLQFIASSDGGMPQNELPDWADWRNVDDLEKRGFISFSTLVPPNKEKECPLGLSSVHVTTAGRDALAEKQRADDEVRNQAAQHKEEKRTHSRERKMDFLQELIMIIIGSALTLLIEHVILS